MLNLQWATPADWAQRLLPHLDEVLVDHAHCETKAASTALGMLFRYPDRTPLLEPLSALAREELSHFELVLGHIHARGLTYGKLRASPYAGRLMTIVRGPEPEHLLDTLLCCALIEARSCERMKLLAEALAPPEVGEPALAGLYRDLLASEARHHATYVELAGEIFPAAQVRTRLREVALHEAAVIAQGSPQPRLHN